MLLSPSGLHSLHMTRWFNEVNMTRCFNVQTSPWLKYLLECAEVAARVPQSSMPASPVRGINARGASFVYCFC